MYVLGLYPADFIHSNGRVSLHRNRKKNTFIPVPRTYLLYSRVYPPRLITPSLSAVLHRGPLTPTHRFNIVRFSFESSHDVITLITYQLLDIRLFECHITILNCVNSTEYIIRTIYTEYIMIQGKHVLCLYDRMRKQVVLIHHCTTTVLRFFPLALMYEKYDMWIRLQ